MSVLGIPLAIPLIAAAGLYALSGSTKKHRHHEYSMSRTRRHRHRYYDEPREKSRKKKNDLLKLFDKKRTYKTARYIKRRSELNLDTAKKEEKSHLYVFYTLADGYSTRKWDYTGLPGNWTRSDGGDTKVNGKYKLFDVFKGKRKYREDMKRYLDKLFGSKLSSGYIKRYKVRSTYKPT
jgi:hypothetical protein